MVLSPLGVHLEGPWSSGKGVRSDRDPRTRYPSEKAGHERLDCTSRVPDPVRGAAREGTGSRPTKRVDRTGVVEGVVDTTKSGPGLPGDGMVSWVGTNQERTPTPGLGCRSSWRLPTLRGKQGSSQRSKEG